MMIQKLWSFLKKTSTKLLKMQELSLKKKILSPIAFGCVVNMAFQLGLPRLLKFKNFQYHLNKCDYESASLEMLDSLWAKQTPNRAKELAETMRSI